MSTIDRPKADTPPAIPAEDMAELQRAVDDMIQGVRDPEAMDRAAKEMDEGREEVRQRLGELDIAVELTDPDSDE
jgi:hypothetical protein